MALETHQEETEHWSEEEYCEEDEDGRRRNIDGSNNHGGGGGVGGRDDEDSSDCGYQLDTEDEMELDRVKNRRYPIQKERLFLI